MPDLPDSVPSSGTRTIVYWIATIILVLECEVGGIMRGVRMQPFLETIQHLGYPTYFMTIHTIWYILGGVALLVPRFPRLKEWAYALVLHLHGSIHVAFGGGGSPCDADGSDCFYWSGACFMGTASPCASATQCKHSHLTNR